MENGKWARRSFVSGLGAAVAAFTAGSRAAAAQTPARPAAFRAARHQKDEWLNTLRGSHRTIVDCATPNGAGEGVLYANNLYVANKSGYALNESDVAVVVCMRHFATVFAYNDAMWAKYGKVMSDMVMFTDPKTKQPPATNLLNSADYGLAMSNLGNTIESVVKRGTHFAVCDMATNFFATQLATATKGNQPDVYKELTSNLIPNSHLVAAGVIAVNRAQEYGYTLLTAL